MKYFNLDLDGVLADFSGRFEKEFGMSPSVFEKIYGTERFWEVIREKRPFFGSLDLMPRAMDIVRYVEDNILPNGYIPRIITAGPKNPEHYPWAQEEKLQWVIDVLERPEWEMIVVRGGEGKHQYAEPGHVLLDDHTMNIMRWNDAGGTGIWCKEHDPSNAFIAMTFLTR